MVCGEVAFRQVTRAARLVIQTIVSLRAVADVGIVPVVDGPVEAAVIAPLVERTRNRFSGLSVQSRLLREHKFRIRCTRFRQALALPLAFNGEEAEELVFLEGTANRSAKELAAVIGEVRTGGTISVGNLLLGIQR